jgi:lipopolysaccharide transport system ATP-binding protein
MAGDITPYGNRREVILTRNEDGKNITLLNGGENVTLEIEAIANERLENPILGWLLKDRLGQDLFGENTFEYITEPLIVDSGKSIKATFYFQMPFLLNGEYSIAVSIAEGDLHEHVQHHWLNEALIIKVSSKKVRYGIVGIAFKKVDIKIN